MNRYSTTQEKAEDFYRNIFNKILSTLTKSLSTRFSAIERIVEILEFLWEFNSMSYDQWKEAARRYTLSRLKDISPDFVEEIIFIEEIYKPAFVNDLLCIQQTFKSKQRLSVKRNRLTS